MLVCSFVWLLFSIVLLKLFPGVRHHGTKMLLGFNLLLFGTLVWFGAAVAALAGIEAWTSWHSTTWKPTLAQVQKSEVEAVQSKGAERYRLRVVYRYWVDGAAYESGRIAFSNPLHSCPDTAEGRRAMHYAVDAVIIANVHPHEPAEAVLEAGFSNDRLWLSLLGVAFVLGGGYALRRVLRRRAV